MNPAFTISVPRLHTERLTLREYRLGDFDLFADQTDIHGKAVNSYVRERR